MIENNGEFKKEVESAEDMKAQSIIKTKAQGQSIQTLDSIVLVDADYNGGNCWSLVPGQSYEFKKLTQIPRCLFRAGVGICIYKDVGLLLTGGLQDLCAIYHAETQTWQTIEQNWVGRYKHASICIDVSTLNLVLLNGIR